MTQYQLIKANESLLRIMETNGIKAKDVDMIQISDRAEELERNGESRTFIINSLASQFRISPRSVYNIMTRLNSEVIF